MTGWFGADHMTGWGWFVMIVSSGLLVVLVVGAVVVLAWLGERRRPRPPGAAPPRSAEEMLAERFARGEISEDEYRRRLATLTATGRGPTPET